MATFKNFEDIIAWQLARQLCQQIETVIRETQLGRDFKLRDQISGSSNSIMNNIAEGFGRGGNKEFIQFLEFAHASCAETRSQLYSILDRQYIDQTKFYVLHQLARRTGKAIRSLIDYLLDSPFKGPRFHRKDD
jgi:four helix bundle protein